MKKTLLATLVIFALGGCAALSGLVNGFTISIGCGKPPTFSQMAALRKANPPLKDVLINGTVVPNKDYPAVIQIFMTGASCSAAVIGPRTILTAAHCANTGDTATFQTVNGGKYTAVMTRGTGYPGVDLDLNLGQTNADIDVAPLSVKLDKFERIGMQMDLIGYGCIQPGGGGGNDGTLRIGQTVISGAQDHDLILTTPNGAALCYGDSGGPVLWKNEQGVLVVVGVNSKGNIVDTSYTTRLTLDDANVFMKAWPLPICGIAANCGAGQQPPAPPAPPAPKSLNCTMAIPAAGGAVQGVCR